MERNKKVAVAGGAVVVTALALGGIGAASATLGDDDDVPITGPALDEATTAALEHVGEGSVTETESGDEDGAYEVEVTLDDGSQIDVHLDADFGVLGLETDDEGSDDDDSEEGPNGGSD